MSKNNGAFQHFALILTISVSLGASAVVSAADQPATIDDLGFSGVMNEDVFSRDYRIQSQSEVPSGTTQDGLGLKTTMEFSSNQEPYKGGLRFEESADSTNGIDIKRFSTAFASNTGTLTVGSDWTNFQDFLYSDQPLDSQLAADELTSEQIRWAGNSGFSAALENDISVDGELLSGEDHGNNLPNLVLSWRGSDPDQRGQYSFSALGRQLELDDNSTADQDSQQKLGWGLNLAGGWHFGDLFAALSVTLGNSIDSLILGRLGDKDAAAAASTSNQAGASLNINPSINFRLNDSSNLHMSINRFQTSDGDAVHGVDTLDTVHLGYSWTPWPSTRIGIEFVGKDVDGPGDPENSNTVNFAASKQF